MTVAITALSPTQHGEAARLLARAFVTNPLHVAVFGSDRLDANEAFFRIGLTVMKGKKHVAMDGARIVGVIHWVDSPHCQFSSSEKVRQAPAMIKGFGVGSAMRVGSWLSAWSQRDPVEPHCHLGPIGVSPEAQGLGIGRKLMELYCDQLESTGSQGYLETDRPRNVDFYKGFGFEVTSSASIQGVVNYFMRRGTKTLP